MLKKKKAKALESEISLFLEVSVVQFSNQRFTQFQLSFQQVKVKSTLLLKFQCTKKTINTLLTTPIHYLILIYLLFFSAKLLELLPLPCIINW